MTAIKVVNVVVYEWVARLILPHIQQAVVLKGIIGRGCLGAVMLVNGESR